MTKIVCWNIDANRSGKAAWAKLKRMKDVDIALLQEVGPGAAEGMASVLGGHEHWEKYPEWNRHNGWPAVVKLSDRVEVKWFRPVPLMAREEEEDQIAVSDLPTLAAAHVTPLPDGEPFIVVSMYARCYRLHPNARDGSEPIPEFADASAHRIISDISGFIADANPPNHRIIAAGDLNAIYGAREESIWETPIRAQTVFDRMNAIGMEFVGPRAGDGSRKADPPSDDVRPSTCNVPTRLSPKRKSMFAERDILSGNQLDYVFASRGLDERARVYALNKTAEEWGPSDHCRIVIELG